MNSQVTIPQDEIAAFCIRWQVTELALFATRRFRSPESDMDGLARFEEEALILYST